MNLLAQNQPLQKIPGRIVGLLTDAPEPDAPYFDHWYLANRAEVLKKAKERREANKDEINRKRREKYAANPEKHRKAANRRYKTNKAYREATKARANARYQRLKDQA